MNLVLSLAVSAFIVAVAHFVPMLVAAKFGPGKGLAVGVFFLVALLGFAFRHMQFSLFDALALAALVRGAVTNYRAYDEAQMKARGEAAIAAAEAQRG
jgi:hypothetical protein